MRLLNFLITFTFPSTSLAKTWTVFDVHRTADADHTICNWNLRINQSTLMSGPTLSCEFQVMGNSTVGCERRPIDALCSNAMSEFRIDGGWSGQGFIVMRIADNIHNLLGWFGWSDQALDSGEELPKQEKFVHPINDQNDRYSSMVSRETSAGDPLETAPTWKVENLERKLFPSENLVWMNFTLEDEAQHSTHCSLMVDGPKRSDGGSATNLSDWSWYNRKCSESDWSVSWGFMEEGDAGVLTVVNPTRNRRCMFGFNRVNEAEDLGSAGFYAVADCNCA